MRRFVQRAWPWIVVVLVAMFLVWRSQVASEEAKDTAAQVKVLAHQNRRLTKGIQNAITAACQVNGNSLRKVIREEIEAGFTDPHDPRLHELLPNVPQSVLDRIAKEENTKRRVRLAKAHGVNCTAVYKHFQLP